MRDWISILRNEIDFSSIQLLSGGNFIKSFFFCILHKSHPYINGLNIYNVYSDCYCKYLLNEYYSQVFCLPVFENSTVYEKTEIKPNLQIIKNLFKNLSQAFFLEMTGDYDLFDFTSQELEFIQKLSELDFKEFVHYKQGLINFYEFFQNKNSSFKIKEKHVNEIIEYGHPKLLSLVPKHLRDLNLAKKTIISSSSKERKYLIQAFKTSWNYEYILEVDLEQVTIKLETAHQEKKYIYPESILISPLIKKEGIKNTLWLVILENKKEIQHNINQVLPVTQQPIWFTPKELLHKIPHGDKYYFLTDIDVNDGMNPYTRKQISCHAFGDSRNYAEIWSEILDIEISLDEFL